MTTLPYSLRSGSANSNEFYGKAARLVDETAEYIGSRAAALLASYTECAHHQTRAAAPRKPELMYDVLALSVLWREYGQGYPRVRKLSGRVRRWLLQRRRDGALPRLLLDPLCAWTAAAMLPPGRGRAAVHSVSGPERLRRSADLESLRRSADLESLQPLVDWLRAAGEYDREAEHAGQYLDYCRNALSERLAADLNRVWRELESLGGWFTSRSLELLGRYTAGVEPYRLKELRSSRLREDLLLRTKPRAVYHLQMAGAEFLNRAYRADFDAATDRLVLVPRCLVRRGKECKARDTAFGLACGRCDASCPVGRLTGLGNERGLRVRIVPHQSAIFTHPAIAAMRSEGTGVIGIACAASLIDGGLKLRAAGVPSQCVLLDYCGCREHWHAAGIPTDLKLERFRTVIGPKT